MCVCSAKGDSPCERIYLSKEEVGEILVRETERRRLRSAAEMPQLSQIKPALPTQRTDNVSQTCLNYEHASRLQQLKTCSVRDVNRCESVNIPNTGDEESLILNCQPVISRHDQTRKTQAFESTSDNYELPDGTGICHNSSSTKNAEDSVDSRDSGGCDVSVVVSTVSCAVPANNDRLDTTPAEAPGPTDGGSKTKKKKKKKTVTFSDNIELVASAADVLSDPVDYMSYAASIGRHVGTASDSTKNTTSATDDSSPATVITADSSDVTDNAVMSTSSSRVRCSLCRQQWIELTDTYCSNCTFYLSRLQMSN